MATLAQNESKKTSMRVKAGQMVSFQNGWSTAPGTCLDMTRGGPEYVINEEQAETVRKIFDLYLAGNGYQKIMKSSLKRKAAARRWGRRCGITPPSAIS